MSTSAIAIREPGALAADVFGDELAAVKNGIAPGLTDAEYDYCAAIERRTGWSLVRKQFYASKQSVYNRETRQYEKALVIIPGIDGYRLTAQRTGKYRGQLGPFWCGPDGVWMDIWLREEPPFAARVGVLHADFAEPLWSVARYSSYVQLGKDGQPVGVWAKSPDLMIAKCAESLSLRKAFPEELSGTYTHEEMMQAQSAEPAPEPTPIRAVARPAPAPPPPPPSNAHQHTELRRLEASGYDLGAALAACGVSTVEDLAQEQAKNAIIAGRAAIRNRPRQIAPSPAHSAPPPPATPEELDGTFRPSASQISLFWATGAAEGWTKDAKREAMATLHPDRLDPARGEVSLYSLSRAEYDDLLALFANQKVMQYDGDGAPRLIDAGPPEGDEDPAGDA